MFLGLAVALPLLLAPGQAPLSTFYNQWAAVLGGLLLLLALPPASPRVLLRPGLWGWAAAAVLTSGYALLAPTGLDEALVLLLALALLAWAATRPASAFAGLACGWALAGVASLAVAAVQVFAPQLADGLWVAVGTGPGRAVGNLRQPNHLATLLACAAVGGVALGVARGWAALAISAWLAACVAGIVLTASRTGLLAGVPLLLLWGALDRQLPRGVRLALLTTPLMAALAWWGMQHWAQASGNVFAAQARLDSEGAGSPSRLAILRDTWTLIQAHPWGVGFAEFNRAWTLTPLPQRPIAFFDHSHNLPLQLVVELGWLAGGGVLLLMLAGLGAVLRAAWRAQGEQALPRRMALLLLLMLAAHSLLEYPLWYAYFLLPTALAVGLALAPEPRAEPTPAQAEAWRALALGGLLLAGWALHEYRQMAAIYAPPQHAAPLSERIARAQARPLFAAHADYAAAMTQPPGPQAAQAASRAAHQLIDAKLLAAWAEALHASGEEDKARHLMQRLREFRAKGGDLDLAARCAAEDAAAWFCQPPQRVLHWREF